MKWLEIFNSKSRQRANVWLLALFGNERLVPIQIGKRETCGISKPLHNSIIPVLSILFCFENDRS